MKIFSRLILALFILLTVSCSDNHLINNKKYLAAADSAFTERRKLAINRDSVLFSVFNRKLNTKQAEALKFLYAYMPLNDLADYSGNFFLANVNMSLKALSETSWGKNIPEDIFLHYVLPYRVNNENLDSFRIAYYDELMEKVRGKDIEQAALEINHWCHEKVSYQPADIRTSSPMNTILSARGRCGEESTLTVAALRTAGIPARQVYTPRWAHTDDNHAWVEIWNNGKWHYMGACEPEAVLDHGWFTEPARRAMLIHTKSFGAAYGNENTTNKFKDYSDVNNLSKYADTKRIVVWVTDRSDKPVNNATVEFQLYNYAEYYPLASIGTDNSGISRFETGYGDLLIWAHKDNDFNFRHISVGETDTVALKLNRELSDTTIDLDLDVPVVRSPYPSLNQDIVKQNDLKSQKENQIRQKYIDSWMKPAAAARLARSLSLDTFRVQKIVARSMGNFKEITILLESLPANLRKSALSVLELLPDKDLRDAKSEVLSDHLLYSNIPENTTTEALSQFVEYVLNPRVANEKLTTWRKYFISKLPTQIKQEADPSAIAKFLDNNIRIAEGENYYNTPLTPEGTWELKVADRQSRAICFVAICRSLGIAARLEPGRNVPQYFLSGAWNDVYFSDEQKPGSTRGYLQLHSKNTNPVPEYYIHFTVARFENGRFNTLDYDYNKKITDFKDELALPPGHYMLVTGNRLADGRVLSSIRFFNLNENEHKTLEVSLRKDLSLQKTYGKIDLASIFRMSKEASFERSCTRQNRLVIFCMEPEGEPSKHVINDLPPLKPEFDSWGGKFIFLTEISFDKNSISGIPDNSSFIKDTGFNNLKSSLKLISPRDSGYPLVLVTDLKGNILFLSSGYRIGIGEELLKYIR